MLPHNRAYLHMTAHRNHVRKDVVGDSPKLVVVLHDGCTALFVGEQNIV